MAEQARTEAPHLCPHCGNRGVMDRLAEQADEGFHEGITSLEMWWLTRCLSCRGVCLLHGGTYDGQFDELEEGAQHPEEYIFDVVYPARASRPRGLPVEIRKALEAADRVRVIDANAYGVLLGRVLEMVCTDQGAPTGKKLARRIEHLVADRGLPEVLGRIAHGIRDLRNAGAHADLGNLSRQEVELLSRWVRSPGVFGPNSRCQGLAEADLRGPRDRSLA